MEIPLTRESAQFLLEVVRYYTDHTDLYDNSPEAAFLLDLIKRLERRIRQGRR